MCESLILFIPIFSSCFNLQLGDLGKGGRNDGRELFDIQDSSTAFVSKTVIPICSEVNDVYVNCIIY